MKGTIELIKSQAKKLTLEISQLEDGRTKERIYDYSLELLMNIHGLEIKINNITHTSKTISCQTPLKISHSTEKRIDDVVKKEIKKIQRKLPNWANRQFQINSKILTLYLKLKAEGNSHITEKMLMNKYGNQSEFYRNFPQMKSISSKNHGKVFDIKNGIVEIWEPVKSYVDEYKNIVFSCRTKI